MRRLPLLLAFAVPWAVGVAFAQPAPTEQQRQAALEALRRLRCSQANPDLGSPLGQMLFQRCLNGASGTPGPRLVGPIPQLVTPSGPLVRPLSSVPQARDGCRQGFVWREAVAGDHVCVSPATRSRARADNGAAAGRVNQVDHSYGPDTCQGGYVWREAVPSDHVCVTPDIRTQSRRDNAAAADRVAPNG